MSLLAKLYTFKSNVACVCSRLQPLRINIANLGSTAHDQYRYHPNMNLDPSASNYFTDALESYKWVHMHRDNSFTFDMVFCNVFFATNLIRVTLEFSRFKCYLFCRSDFYDRKSGTLKQVFALNSLDSQLQSKLVVSLIKYQNIVKTACNISIAIITRIKSRQQFLNP